MDLFSMATGAPVNPGLGQVLMQESKQHWNNLTDSTRTLFTQTTQDIASITPNITLEQVERVKAKVGGVFNDKQMELVCDVYGVQTCNLFTATAILSNPHISTLHKLGQVEAYGEEYNATRAELLSNRITSGFGGVDGKSTYLVRNSSDNYQGEDLVAYNNLTSYEKRTAQRNWQVALSGIFEENIDVTSIHDGTF